jgi:hypothetical protein
MKKLIYFFIILILIIILGVYLIPQFNLAGKVIGDQFNSGQINNISVTKENLPLFLENLQMIKELPIDAVILLKLYNFNTGQRQWEESYVIKKSSVTQGNIDNPDITIVLASKYVPQLNDFCATLQKAKANNDIGYDTKMSNLAFLWKYRGVLKYKGCFG